MVKFACTPDKTPIYGIFRPFVFNNTGKATRGKANHGGNFGNYPIQAFPKLSPLLAKGKKQILDFIRAAPYMGDLCRVQQNLISYPYMARGR
jgi:hypothetical protein